MGKTLGSGQHKVLIAMLIAAREKAGLTQTELAERLGEYQSFVARSGQRRVDVIELIRLSGILHFSAQKLVSAIEKLNDTAV